LKSHLESALMIFFGKVICIFGQKEIFYIQIYLIFFFLIPSIDSHLVTSDKIL